MSLERVLCQTVCDSMETCILYGIEQEKYLKKLENEENVAESWGAGFPVTVN